ncbi:hypothetical protein E4U13_001173 [Claviceps humidiphila]|uniref:Uncharacterized protein n=1 Tax=Claviceps humidiphila TaxID=1294629 RepID=A0A9P7Q3V0_9HYPO|nr:hypothetical protein E4U13_001173 [Claviceps humidiphila]
MKIAAAILLAISGLALAVEQSKLVDRSADVPQKDNRNLKYTLESLAFIEVGTPSEFGSPRENEVEKVSYAY